MRKILALALALAACTAPAAAAKLPVPWDATSFTSGGQNPDAAPGANDFSCKPSAKHPRPVVLVHGLLATMGDNWATMSPLLKNNDFCVFAITYGRRPGNPYFGGLTQMQPSAAELDAFVDRVLAATGASKVDVVGHSEGTVMPRWWMSFLGGRDLVANYVMLTPLWDGTKLAASDIPLGLAKATGQEGSVGTLFDAATPCGSCPQFVSGSDYLTKVDAVGRALPDTSYTNVVTKYDELVSPYTSGILNGAPNAKNFVLQDVCSQDYSEHAAVAFDPMAAQIMLNALDPARAKALPCVLMLPSGAPNPPDVGLAPEGSGTAGASCTKGRALRIRVRARRGERIRRITALVGGKRAGRRRGSALRTITVKGLAPGKRTLRLRLVTNRGRRTVKVKRTVRCAA